MPSKPVGDAGSVSQPNPGHKPFLASRLTIHSWGATGIAAYFIYKQWGILNDVLIIGYKMVPFFVGLLIFLPRVLDSFIDPIMGHASDNMRTRWGRRRPFMVIAAILSALITLVIWQGSPDWGKWGMYAWFQLMAILLFIAYGAFELARTAVSYELSDDYAVRSKVLQVGQVWFMAPQILGSLVLVVVPLLADGKPWTVKMPTIPLGMWHAPGAAQDADPKAGDANSGLHALAGDANLDPHRRRLGVFSLPASLPSDDVPDANASAIRALPATSRAAGGGPEAEERAAAALLSPTSQAATSQAASSQAASTRSANAKGPPIQKGWHWGGQELFTVQLPNLGGWPQAMRYLAPWFVIAILVFGVLPTLTIKERFTGYSAEKKHVDIWSAMKSTMHNRAFVVMVILRVCDILGTSFYGVMATYIGAYCVCGGGSRGIAEWIAVTHFGGAVISLALGFVMVWLAAPLTRWIGKRWGLVAGGSIRLVSAVLTVILMQPGWLGPVFAKDVIFMFLGAALGVVTPSIWPDICDIDELSSGERREGLYSAVYNFIQKLEISVIFLLGTAALGWSGYDAHLDLQPDWVITNMKWMAFTPYLFFIAVQLVVSFFLPNTPEYMAKVRAELDRRRALKAAAEAQASAPPA